jgi:predicted amidohydrolase YtcJ
MVGSGMHSTSIRLLATLGAAFALMVGAVAAAAAVAPDLILAHGHILTLDATDGVAEALAVRAGSIVAVGADAEVLKLAGPRTRVVDLRWRTATPGLIDTHAHIAEGGIQELYQIKLSDARSIAQVVRRVQVGVSGLKKGQWLQGAGWDEAKLAEKRYVTAADLDKVSPDNPVLLMQTTGHYAVVNSYAMKLAHITVATRDPVAGTIDRDLGGVPTGVLKEAAKDAVVALIPPPTAEQRRAGILKSIDTLHREGMTAVKDPLIDAPTWAAYQQLLAQGLLLEHVCVLWDAGHTLASAREALKSIAANPKPPASLGQGTLLSCGAKIFMDGSGGGRTAWMYQDWNRNSTDTDTGNVGYSATDPDVYRQQVALFTRAGVHVGTHAIGDRAIDTVLDTYAAVLKEYPKQGLRHSIIHANVPTDHALELMASLQQQYDAGYPEAQADFMWWIGDSYAGNFGPGRARRLMPFNTYLKRGIKWTGGSDYPVTPVAARYGLWASVVRETLNGNYGPRPFGSAEAIDIHQAMRSYTTWAARQLFLETRIGSLEVGKQADIAVWDRNAYAVPATDLRNLHCEMTIFNGRIVYDQAPP